jgi:Flp pilus assembly protein TadD
MARSFFRPRADRWIEDFASEPYYHPASQRYYRMHREGEKLLFERYQLDAQGQPIHRFEIEVDWILGSGHTSRSYLFRTPANELFLLPIAWYTQTGQWGMAPGFDRPDHPGVERRVTRECMFCHNAYPDVSAGSDTYGAPHEFPRELPEGIGCQRCHGPGAAHVRAAFEGDRAAVRSTIVHPGRLPPARAVEICYGCHFQASVALAGVRRFGRATYSFRPGEPWLDYLVPLDVEEEGGSRDQRFEINHHPYRLEQSRCFLESEVGALACTRCHDPHRKVPTARRKAHYRDACLSCHQPEACSLDGMRDAPALHAAGPGSVAADDCAACHMPRRRTQDVIQTVRTDHRIQRRPAVPELVAPLEETIPVLVDAQLIHPLPEMSPVLAEVYRASAVLRAGGNPEMTQFLIDTLPNIPLSSPEPLLDLIRSLIGERRFLEAERVATVTLEAMPELAQAREWRAVARLQLGKYDDAQADLSTAIATSGGRPEPLFNQGVIFFLLGRPEDAVVSLRRAVTLRPTLPRAWRYLGSALVQLDQREEAEQAFRQGLRVDPADSRAALELGRLLERNGQRAEAVRILEHSLHHGRDPEAVRQALEAVQKEPVGTSGAMPSMGMSRSW